MFLVDGCHVVHRIGPVPINPVLHLALGIVVLILLQVVDKEIHIKLICTAKASIDTKLRLDGQALDWIKTNVWSCQ